MKNFTDNAVLSGTRRTNDGYLAASVRVARTGIQQYTGDEMGRPDLKLVSVYRPEEEVFNKDSMASYAHKPVTDDHPSQLVDAQSWKDLSRGGIGDEVARDGEYVRIPVLVMDAEAISKVEGGKRELSMGYTCDIVWEDGVTPDGEPYQAKQTNLRMNHLAIVDRGRAGHECRIGDNADNQWGVSPTIPQKEDLNMSTELKTLVVDGLSVITTEAGAQAIQKLQKQVGDAESLADKAKTDSDTALAAKDTELAKKDAEIEKLKGEQLDSKALDALVKERSSLVADAALIAEDVDFSGMDNDQIRTAAISAFRGEDAMKDKSQAYIDAAFDLAVEQVSGGEGENLVRKALQNRDHQKTTDNGQSEYENRLNDGWKQQGGNA